MDRPQETARLAQDSEQMDVVSPSGVTDGALKCGNCSFPVPKSANAD